MRNAGKTEEEIEREKAKSFKFFMDKRRQWKRETRCALFLRQKLDIWVTYRNQKKFRADVL